MGNGPCIPSACVHPELQGLRDVGIPIKAAAAASHSPNFSLHRQPRSSAHRHICVVIPLCLFERHLRPPRLQRGVVRRWALTFEVPDAGTDLDWVDFVAQLLALPADPVVDLPWQVSFCPEHFAPANMPFSGHLSDVHPPPLHRSRRLRRLSLSRWRISLCFGRQQRSRQRRCCSLRSKWRSRSGRM
ncbi:hypothetical protein B0H21DRAFT_143244 [Amylocystis lapponica]|nr:hypothetical protein B0H21DRAFT_143244 [Amylocystis lapponica]